MAQTFVQGAHNEAGAGGASLAKAFTSNNAAKNLLVYVVIWDRSAPNPTFGDTAVNTIVDSGNGITDSVIGAFKAQTLAVLAAKSFASINTFTASWGAPNPTFSAIAIHEFNDSVNTGGWSIDKIAAQAVAGANPSSGNTAATTNANEVVFGWCGCDSGTLTAGAGFTAGEDNQPTLTSFSEYKFVTTTGVQNAAFTNAGATNSAAQCTTFFANAAGGGDTLGGAMQVVMMSRQKDQKKIWVPGRRIVKPRRALLRAA